MKNKNTDIEIEKKFAYSKIFQTLKVPERIKRMKELQKNMVNLKHSLVLLQQSNNKRKNTHTHIKQKKNTILFSPFVFRKNEEKKIKKFASLENFVPQNNSNNDSNSISISNSNSKEKNLLYMDRASALRRKNQALIQKMKNKYDKNGNSYRNNSNINKNEIFVTEFNLPNLNIVNGKHNSLRKVFTESNNYYENTINYYKKNNNNDIIGRSSSDRKILPYIKTQKRTIITLPKNKSSKNYIIKNNNTNESLDNNLSISNINNISSDDNEKNNSSKENINTSRNIAKESPRNKIIIKKHNSPLNNYNKEMKTILKNVNNININMKNRKMYYDLQKWYIKSKFKYIDWKYGIADAQKYFIDMKAYGQQEEVELDMRKSFYEKLQSLIDELKEEKDNKNILEIEKKYGIKAKNEEPKVMKDNEYWIDEHASNKKEEMCKIMKAIKERKKKENEKRDKIEEIMFRCKKGVYDIKNS